MTEKTNDIYIFEKDGETHQLVMTYGLLIKLLCIFGQIDDITGIYIDPAKQMEVLSCVSKTYKPDGTVEKELFNPNLLTPEEGDNLKEWVAGHIFDYFQRALLKVKEKEEMIKKIANLKV